MVVFGRPGFLQLLSVDAQVYVFAYVKRNFMRRNRKIRRIRWALAGVSIFAALLACTSDTPETASTAQPTVSPAEVEEVELDVNEGSTSTATADLAKATVQLIAMDDRSGFREPVWTGSGSIISPEGLVLTNAHVVDNRWNDYTLIAVAVTDRTDMPPAMEFLAEVAAIDYDLDLAIVRIVSDFDGNPIGSSFPYVELGDSDNIEIGDHIRILGYPGIGSDTITFTEGAVSGFTSERGIDGRAWIKTDATIAGGSSGGMAVDENGRLIGVPTQASASQESEVVDCRPVADTNRDGWIDELDTCVPIGGFINGLRPSNLAEALVDAASQGSDYVEGGDIASEPHDSSDEARFTNLLFADGVNPDDTPTQLWFALPEGSTQICAFWDYTAMSDGWTWSAYWFVNGELNEDASFMSSTWGGSDSGNWWVCIGDERGLQEGLYEIVLEVEGEMMVTDAVFLGGNRGLADFTVENQSSGNICYVQISPTQAQNWGQDELGAQEVIEPGGERVFQLATGEYDVLMSDCDLNTLVEEYGVVVDADMDFVYPR